MYAIQTSGLKRVFRSYEKPEGFFNSVKGIWNRKYIDKIALSETTLTIEGGQIVGLVGANGAGKTTLLKLLSGLIFPSSGEAKVLGYTPWERKSDFLRKISILLGQKNQLWWDLAPADSYGLLTNIYELDTAKAKRRYLELAEMMGCREQLQTQLRRLSLGERMKMEIIGALLHEPKVLFLDEPTIGLDIVAQDNIRKFLTGYVKENHPTVILTSHYMDDIAKLADRLLLIQKGEMVYDGTVSAFVARAETKQILHLVLNENMQQDVVVGNMRIAAGKSVYSIEAGPKEVGALLQAISQNNIIQEIRTEETDFESVIHKFLQKDMVLR